MKITILQPAQLEIIEAFEYYEYSTKGLGFQFLNEIDHSINLIKNFSDLWTKLNPKSKIRKCVVKKFPYCIYYSSDTHILTIIAVAHFHREPMYWKERIS